MDLSESVSYEQIAYQYDETRGGEPRGAWHARFLASHLSVEVPAVELGVGTGLVAAGLRGLGYHVVGIDLSPAMLSRARLRLGDCLAAGDVGRLPLRSASITCAYCVWLLHLVGNLDEGLQEVARVLAPDGAFLVVPLGRPNKQDDAIAEITETLFEELVALGAERLAEGLEATSVIEHAAKAGLRLVSVTEPTYHVYRQSPATAAASIENRAFASLIDLHDDIWRRVVQPAIDNLRRLPNPETPIVRRGAPQRCVIFSRRSLPR